MFWSRASNLVPSDRNANDDVFVHDRLQGQTVRVSVTSTGLEADSASRTASLSADGRFVVFESYASNLVAGDSNLEWDIFVHDRQTGGMSRVSVGANGLQADNASFDSQASADGRFVCFYSGASNLVPADTNGKEDIFVRDTLTGATSRVSVDSQGFQANEESRGPVVSANGRQVAFTSYASNLVSGDSNSAADVFVYDLGPATLTLSKSGQCPGVVTLTVNNATPSRNLAFVYGLAGTFVKSTPPCLGISLYIFQPTLGAYVAANAAGTATLSFSAPPGVCGLSVQAVDVATCVATNVIVL